VQLTGVSDTCLAPLETGGCGFFGFFSSQSYYFDSEVGQCSEVPSGCSVSDNAFDSLEACEEQCAKHIFSSATAAAATVSGEFKAVVFRCTSREMLREPAGQVLRQNMDPVGINRHFG